MHRLIILLALSTATFSCNRSKPSTLHSHAEKTPKIEFDYESPQDRSFINTYVVEKKGIVIEQFGFDSCPYCQKMHDPMKRLLDSKKNFELKYLKTDPTQKAGFKRSELLKIKGYPTYLVTIPGEPSIKLPYSESPEKTMNMILSVLGEFDGIYLGGKFFELVRDDQNNVIKLTSPTFTFDPTTTDGILQSAAFADGTYIKATHKAGAVVWETCGKRHKCSLLEFKPLKTKLKKSLLSEQVKK